MYIYTVKPGDTLFDIAQKNGVTISALVACRPCPLDTRAKHTGTQHCG